MSLTGNRSFNRSSQPDDEGNSPQAHNNETKSSSGSSPQKSGDSSKPMASEEVISLAKNWKGTDGEFFQMLWGMEGIPVRSPNSQAGSEETATTIVRVSSGISLPNTPRGNTK